MSLYKRKIDCDSWGWFFSSSWNPLEARGTSHEPKSSPVNSSFQNLERKPAPKIILILIFSFNIVNRESIATHPGDDFSRLLFLISRHSFPSDFTNEEWIATPGDNFSRLLGALENPAKPVMSPNHSLGIRGMKILSKKQHRSCVFLRSLCSTFPNQKSKMLGKSVSWKTYALESHISRVKIEYRRKSSEISVFSCDIQLEGFWMWVYQKKFSTWLQQHLEFYESA